MGQCHCNAPVTTKVVQRHNTQIFHVGVSAVDGRRPTMEDAHSVQTFDQSEWGFFGVFDGHGGAECARYTAARLEHRLATIAVPVADETLRDIVLEIDNEYLNMGRQAGTTATFAIARRNVASNTFDLQVGNVGDSRVVLGRRRARRAVPLTSDHHPGVAKETMRIVDAGGFVQLNRVDGHLAVSRALGDARYKASGPYHSKVIAVPDFQHCIAHEGDFLLLCCDGVFESSVFTTESVMAFIFDKLDRLWDLASIASAVSDEALRRGSTDNISVMLVQLGGTPDCAQSVALPRREVFHTEGGC